MVSRHVPTEVRRELREEVNFACAYCGNPLIQYHHIVPFREEEHHDPERMIGLCPNCHAEADAGTLSREKLYHLKNEPEVSDRIEHEFYFEPHNRRLVLGDVDSRWSVGAQLNENLNGKATVLEVNGTPLVELEYLEGILFFNVDFYSGEDIVASFERGEWWADTSEFWDLQYKKKSLKMLNSENNLGLLIRYSLKEDQVAIGGRLEYDNKVVVINENGVFIPGTNNRIAGLTLSVNAGSTIISF